MSPVTVTCSHAGVVSVTGVVTTGDVIIGLVTTGVVTTGIEVVPVILKGLLVPVMKKPLEAFNE